VVRTIKGNYKEHTFTIDGVSGNTGGTLTTPFNHVEFAAVQVEVDTGPAGYATDLLWYILGKTVVVAYADPVDDHTVRITVTGR